MKSDATQALEELLTKQGMIDGIVECYSLVMADLASIAKGFTDHEALCNLDLALGILLTRKQMLQGTVERWESELDWQVPKCEGSTIARWAWHELGHSIRYYTTWGDLHTAITTRSVWDTIQTCTDVDMVDKLLGANNPLLAKAKSS